MHLSTTFTVALTFFSIIAGGAGVVIVQPPVNVVALIGRTAVFTCEAEGGDVIDYIVNGVDENELLLASDIKAKQLGYQQSSIMSDGSKISRSLSVKCSSANNNTSIYCRAISLTSYDVQVSKPAAVLLVEKVFIYPTPRYMDVTHTHVGDIHSFTCIARASVIDFLINGTSAADASVSNISFFQNSISSSSFLPETHIIQRILYVTSSVENNNSYIICRAISGSSSVEIDVETRLMTILAVEGNSGTTTTALLQNKTMLTSNTSITAKILEDPQNVTIYEKQTGIFSCTALVPEKEGMFLAFLVNGDSSELDKISISLGFMTSNTNSTIQPNGKGTILYRTLSAKGSQENNNSIIQCLAIFFTNDSTKLHSAAESKMVSFKVQGFLAAVDPCAHWIEPSYTVANISFSPPYTLPDLNIIGYNFYFTLSAVNSVEFEETTSKVFTSEPFYVWNTNSTTCTRVTIAAYDGLTEGAKSEVKLLVPPPSVKIGHMIYIANDGSVNISFTLNISTSLGCWQNNYIMLQLVNMLFSQTRIFNSIPLSRLTNVTFASENIMLKVNKDYTEGVVTYSDIYGEQHASRIPNFNTDPPLTIKLLSIGIYHNKLSNDSYYEGVKFECEFSLNATENTKGCFIRLVLKSDESIYFNSSTNKTTITDSNVTVLIDEVATGDYTLKGYIIDTDGSKVLAYINRTFSLPEVNTTSDGVHGIPTWATVLIVLVSSTILIGFLSNVSVICLLCYRRHRGVMVISGYSHTRGANHRADSPSYTISTV